MSGVPTDCPNRDERKGWTGDAALMAEAALYMYGMGAVYSRWLDQFEDEQAPSGASNDFVPALGWYGHCHLLNEALPRLAPRDGPIALPARPPLPLIRPELPHISAPLGTSRRYGGGSPNWQTAYPTLVWGLWRYYGDISAAERHHASLGRYYDFLHANYNATGGARGYKGPANNFGDWVVPPPAKMGDRHLIATFALLHDLQMGVDFFNASHADGAQDRAAWCAAFFRRVAADFHAAFFDTGRGAYGSGMQTEQALPLYLGIVPADKYEAVVNHTVADIRARGMHTTCGIVGFKALLESLSAAGRTDMVLAMLQMDSYPSLGYMLKGGAHGYEPATTLWELWDADVEGPQMNSRNHVMFGTVASWAFRWLLGVRPASAGFRHLEIAPSVPPPASNLSSADARVATPLGDVLVSWERVPAAVTCASGVAEGSHAELTCSRPADHIASVVFAAFGNPTGRCDANGTRAFRRGACDANGSASVVGVACVGKQSCVVTSGVAAFGDPCKGHPKHLDVAVACALPPLPPALHVLRLRVSIPIGATAALSVPIQQGRTAADVDIAEGGTLVWHRGAFVRGAVRGLTSAEAVTGAGGEAAIRFDAHHGSYSFVAA